MTGAGSLMLRPGYVTRLVPFAERHVDAFLEWFYDVQYAFFFRDYAAALTREQALKLTALNEKSSTQYFVIEDKATSAPVGLMTCALEKPSARIYKFGIMLITGNQGKAWAIDAINILGHYLFINKRAHKIVCEFSAEDTQIHRITAKGGFLHEATLKEELFVNGRYYDEFRFSLHEDRYRELYLHFLDGAEA